MTRWNYSMAGWSRDILLLKLLCSLRIARTAVRQSTNAGECFRESHGFLVNSRNFSCNCLRGPSHSPGQDLKSFWKKLCIRAIFRNSMPCKRLRRTSRRALLCDHEKCPQSTVSPRPNYPQGDCPNARQTWKLGCLVCTCNCL